jgi:hypothetical protein
MEKDAGGVATLRVAESRCLGVPDQDIGEPKIVEFVEIETGQDYRPQRPPQIRVLN